MYDVIITTEDKTIKEQIEELKELKELLLKYQNENIEVEVHERKVKIW